MSLVLVFLFGQSAFAFGKHQTSSTNGESYRLYHIKKGNHYASGDRLDFPMTKTTFNYSAIFDDTAKYTTVDPSNQADINKLVGFSDCGELQDHKHSARFGWTWYQGALQIYAYTYANSKRSYEYMCDAAFGKPAEYSIRIDGSQYVFTFNGRETRMTRGCSRPHPLKAQLYPYFGGNETAPHAINILLRLE